MLVRNATEKDRRFSYDFDIDLGENTYILQTNGLKVGVLEGEWHTGTLYLDYIEIHSDFRGRGYGRETIEQLVEEGVRIIGNAAPESVAFWQKVGVEFGEGEEYMQAAAKEGFCVPFILHG